MIICQSIIYRYPGTVSNALNGISVQIARGEFVLTVGASGAGKSTWLRTLNGLVPHFSGGEIDGSIVVDGISVVEAGPEVLSRTVGFVFQNPEAQAVLDRVEAEVAFALENAAIVPDEMERRVEDVLARLELTALRDRAIETLSGGELQRVAIASALALQPKVLVLDEPTSQLDPDSAELLLNLLVTLNRELNLTIILAEHRLKRILPFATRLLYFENGFLTLDTPVRNATPATHNLPPIIQQAFSRKSHRPPSPDDAEAVLDVENLSFHYANSEALAIEKINLTVYAGEIMAVMGRNGSGKSTLLKCIIGLKQPKAGVVRLGDKTITGRKLSEIAREITYLPQNPDDLLFADSVREEPAITLKNHGLPVDDDTINRLLDALGILRYADAYPRDLSVGERQRVALAALLITEPSVILLDEPTRGLDNVTKSAFADLLVKMREAGKLIVLVTHDVDLTAQVADRIAILENGRVASVGHSAEIHRQFPAFAPKSIAFFRHNE